MKEKPTFTGTAFGILNITSAPQIFKICMNCSGRIISKGLLQDRREQGIHKLNTVAKEV